MDIDTLRMWKGSQRSIFTSNDLKIIFSSKSELSLSRQIRRWVASGKIIKIKNGLYCLPDCSLAEISTRLCPSSYISTDWVLAQKAVIGTVPANRVQAVKIGRPKNFSFALGKIQYLSIKPELFFGFDWQDGVAYATLEKAFLDVCYFTYKRNSFPFDPYSDIDLQRLNKTTINQYLQNYDKRFVSFFKNAWRF